jgi:5-methylcytosine-specific restriction endonuclease McrA
MDEIVTEKKCTKCGKWKKLREYVKDPGKKDGLYSSCKECYKKSYYRNRDKNLERAKKYQSENPEKVIKNDHEYYLKHKQRFVEYRKKNPEAVSRSQSEWRKRNPEKVNIMKRKWREANREKCAATNHARRARVAGNGGKFTAQEWKDLCERYENKCLCCGRSDVKLAADHVIPLKNGGVNTIENLQPLCKSCNSSKGARHRDYRPISQPALFVEVG